MSFTLDRHPSHIDDDDDNYATTSGSATTTSKATAEVSTAATVLAERVLVV